MMSCNLPSFWFFQDQIKLRLFTGLKNLKKLVLEIGAKDDESLLFTPFIEACSYLQIFVLKVRVFLTLKKKKKVFSNGYLLTCQDH
jgi:hypothetical protein